MSFTPVPKPGKPKQQRAASDLDFSQFGKHADNMRAGYLSGGYTPLDFDSVPGNPSPGNPSGGDAGGGGTTNTSQTSPYMEEQINRYRERFNVDNTKRAIDKSNLGIMDAAALASADAKAGQSRRGVLSTGVSAAQNQRNIFEPAQRAAASAAANITMQREKDLDALVLGGTSLMRAPDEIALANRGLNLQQLGQDREDQRFRTQLEIDERRRREEAARWQAMAGSLGDYGDAGTYGVKQVSI
jgi:hypothetical protein